MRLNFLIRGIKLNIVSKAFCEKSELHGVYCKNRYIKIVNNIIKIKLKFVASVAELLPYFSLIISVVRNKAPYDIFPNEIVNPNISDSLIV